MLTMEQHFKLVNESTLQGNYNTGQVFDLSRKRLDEKQQFAKRKKLEYNSSNFIAEQTSPQSNYGRLK